MSVHKKAPPLQSSEEEDEDENIAPVLFIVHTSRYPCDPSMSSPLTHFRSLTLYQSLSVLHSIHQVASLGLLSKLKSQKSKVKISTPTLQVSHCLQNHTQHPLKAVKAQGRLLSPDSSLAAVAVDSRDTALAIRAACDSGIGGSVNRVNWQI